MFEQFMGARYRHPYLRQFSQLIMRVGKADGWLRESRAEGFRAFAKKAHRELTS
jgi:hypothetical protein